MAEGASSTFTIVAAGDDELSLHESESGWIEARTHCDHLASLSSDSTHIPTPDTPCHSCQHPTENWVCLICKDVLCSRFVNQHMLQHFQQKNHCLALSYRYTVLHFVTHVAQTDHLRSAVTGVTNATCGTKRCRFDIYMHHWTSGDRGSVLLSDLSVWCFSCDAYLDAQVILPLWPFYETAYILKFGEAPPFRAVVDDQAQAGTSRS